MIARLKAYAPLRAINGGRVYDTAPPPPKAGETNVRFKAFTSMGDPDAVPFANDGRRGSEVTLQIDNWAQATDSNADFARSADEMNGHVCDALFGNQVTEPNGWTLHFVWIEGARVTRDPDGVTAHGIVTVVAQLTPD